VRRYDPVVDLNTLAHRIVEKATDESTASENPRAVAGRKGGKKGGKARAAKLTAAERSAAAKRAAEARWAAARPEE
jgi:hypothetical protein